MSKVRVLSYALALLPLATLALGTAATSAAAADPEVSIKITKVRALDRADEFSDGDYFARVTIDGETFQTEPVKQEGSIKPNWAFKKKVKAGEVKVKLEIIDKDLSADDPIDINRVDAKRDLDFTVNTKTGRLGGFSSPYKVGTTVTRAGKEKKAAEVSFVVTVKK
jgi:hypothetical protein